jgi:hypothetical protein
MADTTQKCIDCREDIAAGARVCHICKARQDWRRYLAFGQINLALLIALISVSTSFVNVALPFLKPQGSAIQLLFEAVQGNTYNFLARNIGRSGGVLRLEQLTISANGNEYPQTLSLPLKDEAGTYIEPGREVRIAASLATDTDNNISAFIDESGVRERVAEDHPRFHGSGLAVAYLNELSCAFSVKETSFNAPVRDSKDFPVNCRYLNLTLF